MIRSTHPPTREREEGGLEKNEACWSKMKEPAKPLTCKLESRMKAHAEHGGHVILGDLPALDQSHRAAAKTRGVGLKPSRPGKTRKGPEKPGKTPGKTHVKTPRPNPENAVA